VPTQFLIVPVWQGTGSSRAMRLIDGADAIAGDLPARSTTRVEVPMEAGESLGTGVRRYAALRTVHENVDAAAAPILSSGTTLVTVGGGCEADGAVIARLAGDASGSLALLWFDAHADLHTPGTSPSSAFGGMALRALIGDGPETLASPSEGALPPSSIVLAGARALEDEEVSYIEANGIRSLGIADAESPGAVAEAVVATDATRVYIHVDLDVLDPASIDGVTAPEPFGLAPTALVDAIVAVRRRLPLAGAGISGFAPASPAAAADDLPAILRVLGALTRPLD
jgi:arginase